MRWRVKFKKPRTFLLGDNDVFPFVIKEKTLKNEHERWKANRKWKKVIFAEKKESMGSVNEVERLKPYGDGEKTEEINQMFDGIAPVYDDMNRKMTFGADAAWRQKVVRHIGKVAKSDAKGKKSTLRVLDLAKGTGDMAIAIAKGHENATVVGIDMSDGMLSMAREKVACANVTDRVRLTKGDCLHLPFADKEFDVVTVSFGLRNFASLEKGLKEANRVLEEGGRLVVLEMVGTYKFFRPFYWLYTQVAIPIMRSLSGGEKRAYEYLPKSIDAFPGRKELKMLLEKCGFKNVTVRRMTFGVCEMVMADK